MDIDSKFKQFMTLYTTLTADETPVRSKSTRNIKVIMMDFAKEKNQTDSRRKW